jgi:hypothetical protein
LYFDVGNIVFSNIHEEDVHVNGGV